MGRSEKVADHCIGTAARRCDDVAGSAPMESRVRPRVRRLAFRVGARAVDIRHLRTHCAQVRGELSAMVDAVIVGKSDVLRVGHFHHAEKTYWRGQLLGRQRAQLLELLRKGLLIEGDDFVDTRELRFRLFSGIGVEFELSLENAVDEPDVGRRQVSRELPCGCATWDRACTFDCCR